MTDVVDLNGEDIQQRIWSKDHAQSEQDLRKKSSTPFSWFWDKEILKNDWAKPEKIKEKLKAWLRFLWTESLKKYHLLNANVKTG